jgi:alpha-glucosidase (family GH31 glycosyl hydrolase)
MQPCMLSVAHHSLHPSSLPKWPTPSCRWGYRNLSQVEQVVANYSAAGLPLEVMWSDID